MFNKSILVWRKVIIPVTIALIGLSCIRQDGPVEPDLQLPSQRPATAASVAALAADMTVYGDALQSPWLNSSWSADVVFNSTEQVSAGSGAIKVSMRSAWAALSVHYGYWFSNPGIDPASFQSLDFTVYSSTAGMKLTVFLENDDGYSFPKVNYGAVAAGQWVSVSIPMSQLSPGGTMFHRISIQEISGAARVFFVDEILLKGGGGPEPVPPPAPTLSSPQNGSTGVDTNPTLSWNATAGADSYRIQLASASDFSSPLVDQGVGTATSYGANGLSNGTTYYWRVNASNEFGTGSWSATWQFTTRTASVDAPDLTIDAERLRQTIDIRWRTVSSSSCAVVEGCAQPGSRKLLRFDVVVMNFGEKDLVMGDPERNPEAFQWSPCHGHYHYEGFAEYRLFQGSTRLVTGHKQAFCLMDSERYWSGSPSRGYDCHWQGISVGWGDVYARSIDCQWIDVTGVAPGNYTLEVEVNYTGTIDEGDNAWPNIVRVPVRIR